MLIVMTACARDATRSSAVNFPPFRLLFLLLLSFIPSNECTSLMSALDLLVDVDRISALGLSDVFRAYQLVQSDVNFISQTQTNIVNIADVLSTTVDFAVISDGLTAAQASVHPELQTFPALCSAVVPIYRLDALNGPLLLSRQALAGIYAGDIRWWNDSAIQSINGGTLPVLPIRVVYEDELSDVNLVFLTALNKFHSEFPVAASSTPTWPVASYAAHGSGTGVTGVSSAVLTVDGSIGYEPQSYALASGVKIASMLNWANHTVTATPFSVTAAITEVASGYTAIKQPTQQLDYTDGHGALSWPIPILSNLLIDLTNSRGTCHQRTAVVEFWSWFYTSSVPAGLLASRQYATIPAFLYSQLDPVSALQTTVHCRGHLVGTVVSATARRLSTSTGAQFISSLLANAYRSVDDSVSWQTEVNDDELVMDQVINAETDIGFFIPGQREICSYCLCAGSRRPHRTDCVRACCACSVFCWLVNRERRPIALAAGIELERVSYPSHLPHCSRVVVRTQFAQDVSRWLQSLPHAALPHSVHRALLCCVRLCLCCRLVTTLRSLRH